LGLALLGTAILLALVAMSIARYPQDHLNPPSADIAMVLGARSQDGRLLPVFRARVDYALHLYREGKVKKVLFTGGANVPEKISQAEVARRYAIEQGLPEADLLVEELSMRTLENFREAVKILPDPGASVLIVSDPLHLKRAMLMAKDVGIRAEPAPVPQTLVRSRWNRFKFLVRETFGYVYYWLFRR
jgi:uncharacterized SAM-binding protein YcdF (DUF218 family)